MIGEAALNGLFQWLPQGLFDIGKWGLSQRWNGNGKCPNKRKKGEEEEEEGIKKRSKHCPSFLLKHKLVLEQSGSSLICAPLSRVEAPEDSTLESCPVISFSIGVSSPLGKKACSYASAKDPSPVPHQAAPLAALKSGAEGVSAVCSAQGPQLPAATTTTTFFDPICSLYDDSDDDEAASVAVATANSVDHPPLEALKGQLKQVLDKGPKMITSQDQSTMAQLCEAIERHPAYSAADHGAMWTLRHLAKSFADILELSNSCQGLAEANDKYAQAKAELRAKQARARQSHAEIEQRQRVAEKLNSEASRLRLQLAATEARLTELENEVKMEKERDAAHLHSIRATSNSCRKARTERGRLQRENLDLNKKMMMISIGSTLIPKNPNTL